MAGVGQVRAVPLPQPEESNKTCLRLVTDLSRVMPADLRLDFDVAGFSLETNFIGVAMDDVGVQLISSNQCQLRNLATGYHLVRAFLVYSDHTCVKSDMAYVEAEFYVKRQLVQLERPFMFGQPSIITIQADQVIDFFVHNVDLSPETYAVRIVVDNEVVDDVDEWVPYELEGLQPGEHTLRLTLINTFGEEITTPKYNAMVHTFFT
ncbi:uncharacterized protein AMSG_08795 [Thecamonas trahens ATCC 50062]|uniref:Uncharacterized protein n=1 Tax=Thecamonas trahens ATCC 50062 TaxID=461836 RepID=A0A0L0DMN6_THETB|nr:hypothetical protein AMSG_08795 [Thecamonas trahens ATCC 50062]KNC53301.1 hypothetical protein AMSG_08795 [Thecamonas trahens ATCC 50062]|eukprot:XP_013754562.1 hypothetical protein AMSG_08795 [Thecamonas trahens ATCC 50062]